MNAQEFREALSAARDDRNTINHACATRINNFWQERGYEVNARVETMPAWNGVSYLPLAVIVSDTINGLPR